MSTGDNGINSRSFSAKRGEARINIDSTNWTEFLYSNFESTSTDLEEIHNDEKVAPLESIISDETNIKDEFIEFDYTNNGLVYPDAAKVEISDQKISLQSSKPEEITPKCQPAREFVNVDILVQDDANDETADDRLIPLEDSSESRSKNEGNQNVEGRQGTADSRTEIALTKMLTSKYRKVVHAQCHTRVYRHKCRFCGKGFGTRYRLLVHEREVHDHDGNTDSTFWSCYFCGKLFMSSSALALHESTHSRSRKRRQCDRDLKNTQNLNNHEEEPMDRRTIVATDVSLPLEPSSTDKVHTKDESIETDCTNNGLTDQNTVDVDISKKDSMARESNFRKRSPKNVKKSSYSEERATELQRKYSCEDCCRKFPHWSILLWLLLPKLTAPHEHCCLAFLMLARTF